MNDLAVLIEYVTIADPYDLRQLALQFAIDAKYKELELVTTEIKNRAEEDKARTKRITEKDVENRFHD
jgi:hypothetical protein